MPARPKRPRDPNQLGKLVVDIAIGDAEDTPEASGKNPVSVESGHKGGRRGGKARAERLSSERRSEIARKAAEARWHPSAAD